MGLTFLKLEVANASDPAVTETVEFLIDSGAIFSIVPRIILQRLGISPLTEQTFRLASGQSIRRQTGAALFKYQDKIGAAVVIFGEEDDSTLLGAHTLEALGYALDPIRRELIPLPMMLA
jgi:clan AA aspartic protease